MEEDKQLRSFIILFQKLTECPICLDTLKIPFRQCARGHLMCSSCAEPLKCCPTCEADLSIENPIGVKNILEALPKFCCYSSDGCKAVVVCDDQHETQCGFRPEPCRAPSCNSVVPVNQLGEHYYSQHPNFRLLKSKTLRSYDVCILNFDLDSRRHDNILISEFGHYFWFVYRNDTIKQEFSVTCELIPIGKPDEDYYARVKFEEGNFVYVYTVKACQGKMKKGLKDGESDSSSDYNGNTYCMRLPTSELKRFINRYNQLELNVVYFKVKQH